MVPDSDTLQKILIFMMPIYLYASLRDHYQLSLTIFFFFLICFSQEEKRNVGFLPLFFPLKNKLILTIR